MGLFRIKNQKGCKKIIAKLSSTYCASSLLLLDFLMGCTGKPDGVVPINNIDINRYQGVWYEIMRLDHRFERGLSNVTATYDLKDDGTVDVLNRGFDREKCSWEEAHGTAEFLGDKTIASLSVTFFWPFSGGYHVFALDEKNYDYALISGPSRDFLWVMARMPSLPVKIKSDLVRRAREEGFLVDLLLPVAHGSPTCLRKAK